ncbi:hypothetical protein B0T24DRAFT_676872 [Lasiosphaeria ovina]|uniref:Uncharacterized protein n=1 Tax=Lasiosphaeria ovina TaxID=92902 RepID=A0AAE0NB05_9PEZI|nr:hypothetical protein B0T24DRAFT_676872 [Lasiosphaeria ovina]
MAWGREKVDAPRSTISHILPLAITLLFLALFGWVSYQIYQSVMKIKAQAKKQMGDRNVVFTKDGVRVGVQHVEDEDYLDATQSWFVKAWNLGSNPEVEKHRKNR